MAGLLAVLLLLVLLAFLAAGLRAAKNELTEGLGLAACSGGE